MPKRVQLQDQSYRCISHIRKLQWFGATLSLHSCRAIWPISSASAEQGRSKSATASIPIAIGHLCRSKNERGCSRYICIAFSILIKYEQSLIISLRTMGPISTWLAYESAHSSSLLGRHNNKISIIFLDQTLQNESYEGEHIVQT